MEILQGDIINLKKKHPCGSFAWKVIRAGADCRLECCGCGHQVMFRRSQVEKGMKSLFRDNVQIR
jgi:hypothetical protein